MLDAYRYGFNGKENDNEVKGEGNQQDYGMRVYDPRLGRFLSIDPLTDDYPELTPYQFSSNSPLANIDLDGAEACPSTEPKQNFLPPTAPITAGATSKLAEAALENAAKNGGQQLARTAGASMTAAGAGAVLFTFLILSPDFDTWGKRWTELPPQQLLKPQPVILPLPVTQPSPSTPPVETPVDEPNNKKGGFFYVTYTKTKVNTDGTTTTYSGRTSGWYSGSAPTDAEADAAVRRRDNGHVKLKREKYGTAVRDKYSKSYSAIRGREQQLIDFNGGAKRPDNGTSRNIIRGVGRNNPFRKLYDVASTLEFKQKLPSNNPADKKQLDN